MANSVYDDFLIEIGTEELPSKSLSDVSRFLGEQIEQELKKAEIQYGNFELFATPRRLAVLVKNISNYQKDREVIKTGPQVTAAYDAKGKPTPAATGFAKSCGVAVEELKTTQTPKGECLYYKQIIPGKTFVDLVPEIIKKTIEQVPQTKMYWGEHKTPFIRPVHWILMIYGKSVISCELFDLKSGSNTFGHRFHHPENIKVNHPSEYVDLLCKQGFVIPNFEDRKKIIKDQIQTIAKNKGKPVIEENLLTEVTGLVEWPVALIGHFEERFLKVPHEALISSMKYHQKSFHLEDNDGHLLPYFITIANIQSLQSDKVILGNERVMRARLADAEFFYHSDLKHGMEHQLERLQSVIFQEKLGTLYEKANRLKKLAGTIAELIHTDKNAASRAGLLCKADLTTEMVGEFPELQGIMGYYYALADHETETVAVAIKEHYLPKFSGDILPTTTVGNAVALADRLDTLVGIFGINHAPTGDKDPYGLRRAALAALRIIIEHKLPLDLRHLLNLAKNEYPLLENTRVIDETLEFVMERLRSWYIEQGVPADVYSSVFARYPTAPLDFDKRIKAVQHFQTLPEAKSLAQANKRVSNILKQTILPPHTNLNYDLFQFPAEEKLADIIEHNTKEIEEYCRAYDYESALTLLAQLRDPIDQFFDHVMVMVEDENLKNNRLILLNNLRSLFLQIADISLLQMS